MKNLSTEKASILLAQRMLEVDEWNRLRPQKACADLESHQWLPDSNIDIYLVAAHLVQWLGVGSWVFIQVDNSTTPIREELYVIQQILGFKDQELDIFANRSIFIEHSSGTCWQLRMTQSMMLIYFFLKFCWHVDLISDESKVGQHLRLNDGVIYFYGKTEKIKAAQELTFQHKIKNSFIADWQLNIENLQ